VDDICDGGGTFLGLAEATGLPWSRVDLYVSHGVFSKNALKNLSEKFEYVYTTNSYDPQRALTTRETEFQDEDDTFERFDVIRLLLSKIKY
jgi:ribose-phosphate pyrophosphokinase